MRTEARKLTCSTFKNAESTMDSDVSWAAVVNTMKTLFQPLLMPLTCKQQGYHKISGL